MGGHLGQCEARRSWCGVVRVHACWVPARGAPRRPAARRAVCMAILKVKNVHSELLRKSLL